MSHTNYDLVLAVVASGRKTGPVHTSQSFCTYRQIFLVREICQVLTPEESVANMPYVRALLHTYMCSE